MFAERKLDKEKIARAVAEFPKAPEVEGVHPLNPGFFQLERMRMASASKQIKLKG